MTHPALITAALSTVMVGGSLQADVHASAPSLRLVHTGPISGAVNFGAGCSPTADENTAQIAVDPGNPSHVVAGYTVGAGVAEVLATSYDRGRTWRRTLAGRMTDCGTSAAQGLDPDLAIGRRGRAWASQGFLSSDPTATEHDAVREYVSSAAPGHGFTAPVDVDPQTPTQRGWLLADANIPGAAYVLNQRTDFIGTYIPGWPVDAIALRASTDGGRTWSIRGRIGGIAPGHALLAAGLERTGDALVAFVHDVFLPAAAPALVQSGGAQASGDAVAYRSTDGGVTWSRAGVIGTQTACCLLDTAAAPDGTLYATWPEASPAGGTDIFLSRSTDGGRTWEDMVAGHTAGGIPTVSLATDDNGALGMFWYAGGQDSARPDELTPQVASSRDRGATWSVPLALAAPFDPATITTFNDTGPLGPYQDIAGMPHGFAVAFTVGSPLVTVDGTSDVVFAEVSDAGVT